LGPVFCGVLASWKHDYKFSVLAAMVYVCLARKRKVVAARYVSIQARILAIWAFYVCIRYLTRIQCKCGLKWQYKKYTRVPDLRMF
jgi:hypothetical protein